VGDEADKEGVMMNFNPAAHTHRRASLYRLRLDNACDWQCAQRSQKHYPQTPSRASLARQIRPLSPLSACQPHSVPTIAPQSHALMFFVPTIAPQPPKFPRLRPSRATGRKTHERPAGGLVWGAPDAAMGNLRQTHQRLGTRALSGRIRDTAASTPPAYPRGRAQ
jgi:hypothetical protein